MSASGTRPFGPVASARPGGAGGPLLLDVLLLSVLAVALVANMAVVRATGPMSVVTPVTAVAAFAVGRLARAERTAASCFVLLVLGRLAVASGSEPREALADVILTVMFGVLPWLTGRYLRQRADLLAAVWHHADLLQRQRAVLAEQERVRERTRIAEEMHDCLGHELSLIAVRAGALQVAPGLGEDDFRRAAAELRADSAAALRRLQEIVGLLHGDGDGGAAEAPASDLRAGITGLVERARAAGMDVRLRGRPAAWASTDTELVCRTVREALTNAAKHAPGAAVTVRVGGLGRTAVTVRNGPPPEPPTAVASGGRGLAALKGRVRAAGGTLRWGGLHGGGFAVRLRLPRLPALTGARDTRELAALRRRADWGLATLLLVPAGLLMVLLLAWYGLHDVAAVSVPGAGTGAVGDGGEAAP